MGIRGELFSNRIILPNRTYFFNVKENRMGDLYLNIVESKNRDNGGFDRQSVILFADDLQEFLKGFDESLRVMEKAIREKRHSGRAETARTSFGSGARNEEGYGVGERPRRNEESRDDRRFRRDEGDRDRDRPRRNEEGRDNRDRPRRNERQSGGYGGNKSRSSSGKGPRKQSRDYGSERQSRSRSGSGEDYSSERRSARERRVVVRKKD